MFHILASRIRLAMRVDCLTYRLDPLDVLRPPLAGADVENVLTGSTRRVVLAGALAGVLAGWLIVLTTHCQSITRAMKSLSHRRARTNGATYLAMYWLAPIVLAHSVPAKVAHHRKRAV